MTLKTRKGNPEGPHSPVPRKIMNHQSVPQISLCVLNARSVRGKKLERAAYICDYVVENRFDCVGITWPSPRLFLSRSWVYP